MNMYSSTEYWNKRYANDSDSFEWYQPYNSLRKFCSEILASHPSATVLHLGCGTSKISEELVADGAAKVASIDYSETCIRRMAERHAGNPALKFQTMDMRDLKFEEASFDFVFDKGALDTVFCSENGAENVQKALRQIARVLKPGGVYLCVSYGMPEFRSAFLAQAEFDWSLKIEKLLKPTVDGSEEKTDAGKADGMSYHYVYICTKHK